MERELEQDLKTGSVFNSQALYFIIVISFSITEYKKAKGGDDFVFSF